MRNQNNTKNEKRQEVISRDSLGRALDIRVDGHIVSLSRLDPADLILSSCHAAESGEPCEANGTGICLHCLESVFIAAADAHVTITSTRRLDTAERLATEVGGKVLMFRSEQTAHGAGRMWLVVGK